jgi:hypothetical protein
VTADHWSFVLAAYGLAAVVLVAYWRFLVRRERELSDASVVGQQLRQGSSASESQATVSRHPSP